jgi:hypothetical protein
MHFIKIHKYKPIYKVIYFAAKPAKECPQSLVKSTFEAFAEFD